MAAKLDPTANSNDLSVSSGLSSGTPSPSSSDLKPPAWVMDDIPQENKSKSSDSHSEDMGLDELNTTFSHPAFNDEETPSSSIVDQSPNGNINLDQAGQTSQFDLSGYQIPTAQLDTISDQTVQPLADTQSTPLQFTDTGITPPTQPLEANTSAQAPTTTDTLQTGSFTDNGFTPPSFSQDGVSETFNQPPLQTSEDTPTQPFVSGDLGQSVLIPQPQGTDAIVGSEISIPEAVSDMPSPEPQLGEYQTQTSQETFTPQPVAAEPENSQFTPPPPQFSSDPNAPQPVGDPASGFVAADLHPKESPLKKVLLIVLGIVLVVSLGVIAFRLILPLFSGDSSDGKSGSKSAKGGGPPVTLTYWGLWEPNQVIESVFAKYKQEHPNVTINYIQQSNKDYRERLQNALAQGQGPDIFRFHNTWLPMLKNDLQPDTSRSVDLSQYFPVVGNNVNLEGQVYGVPLGFDTLLLYYNPALLQQEGFTVPLTWDEFRSTAFKLTKKDDQKRIIQAGAAMGTTSNVDHFSDILGLMLLQSGGDPANPTDSQIATVLSFYTNFYAREAERTWDETLPNSTYAFATEKVAMIFAPSWRAFEINQINPNLSFATAPVPQLPGERIAWATYWVEGVSKRSKNADEAWKLLQFLSQDQNLTALYTSQGSMRMFGEPYPKKTLASQLSQQSVVGSVVSQGDYAKSWFLASRTFDNGINDRIIKYYEDALNAILRGSTAEQVQPTLSQGVTQVLTQYNVAIKTSVPTTGTR